MFSLQPGESPHYFGRGTVQLCAPLTATGAVNPTGYGARWGDNWPDVPGTPGELPRPAGRFVGNARGLTFQARTERAKTSAWDTGPSLVIQGVQATLTLYGHGGDNLADALSGERSQAVAFPTTDTLATGRANLHAGDMLFTRHLVDTAFAVTVSPSWATWTEGVEWQREAFGARLLVGVSGPIGSTITIGYTPEGGADQVDALRKPGVELGIVYTGINRTDGSACRVDAFRARPTPEGGLSPISEEFGTLTLTFDVLPVYLGATHWYRVQRGNYPTNF